MYCESRRTVLSPQSVLGVKLSHVVSVRLYFSLCFSKLNLKGAFEIRRNCQRTARVAGTWKKKTSSVTFSKGAFIAQWLPLFFLFFFFFSPVFVENQPEWTGPSVLQRWMRVMEDLTVKKRERSETQDTVAVCPGVFFLFFFLLPSFLLFTKMSS